MKRFRPLRSRWEDELDGRRRPEITRGRCCVEKVSEVLREEVAVGLESEEQGLVCDAVFDRKCSGRDAA